MIGLMQGETLGRPGIWKRLQLIVNIVTPILMLVAPDYGDAIVQTVSATNAYLTIATTTKLGA